MVGSQASLGPHLLRNSAAFSSLELSSDAKSSTRVNVQFLQLTPQPCQHTRLRQHTRLSLSYAIVIWLYSVLSRPDRRRRPHRQISPPPTVLEQPPSLSLPQPTPACQIPRRSSPRSRPSSGMSCKTTKASSIRKVSKPPSRSSENTPTMATPKP